MSDKCAVPEVGFVMGNEAILPTLLTSIRSSRGLSTSSYCKKGVLMRRGGGELWDQTAEVRVRMKTLFLSSFVASDLLKTGHDVIFWPKFIRLWGLSRLSCLITSMKHRVYGLMISIEAKILWQLLTLGFQI